MDQEQGPQLKPGSIPRLSKLPMPRPSHDNLRIANTASTREPVKSTTLPRPARNHIASIISPSALGENVNRSLRDRYGWTSQNGSVRSRSPVRDALQAAQSSALDTTPPSSNGDIPIFEDGNENPTQQVVVEKKPTHRMSLSERTIETLSQISPSPSPTRRRRESQLSNDAIMGPPPRPASSMRGSRSATPALSRPQSPVKVPFRPPGRSDSPSKEHTLPAVPSPGSLFSPPRAMVKGGSSRIGKPMRETKRSISNIAVVNAGQSTPTGPIAYSAQTVRVQSSHHSQSHANSVARSLEAIFKDPSTTSQIKSTAKASNQQSGLLKPRSIGENTLAISPSPKAKKETVKRPSSKASGAVIPKTTSPGDSPGAKSSTALRESIAKAKAARRNAASQKPSTGADSTAWPATDDLAHSEIDFQGSNRGLLRKRIEAALTSGHLNISAMKLDGIPDEALKMYEPNESINWAEIVDLTKFVAADNQIELLEDAIFPDCSLEAGADDDDQKNQWGGVQTLDLHNNLLQSLPLGLRRLERLTSLNLSGNKLTNASLEIIWQLPIVQDLNLGRNKLGGTISIPGSIMANLRSLSLQDNQIEDLEIASDVSSPLTKLDVSNNRLRRLPWELLSSFDLVQLNASGNSLTVVAINPAASGFASLKELDLSRNTIELIEQELALLELQVFNINNNKLSSLPDLTAWQHLVTLQASENQLSDLPKGLTTLLQLRNADLSHNNIKVLDPLLAKMEFLTSLQLAGNPLRDRKYLTMNTADLKDDLLKRLGPADVSDNAKEFDQSGDIPTGSTAAEAISGDASQLIKAVNGILDLGSKSLTNIDLSTIDLGSSTPIHTCRLSNNELTAFPFELLSHPSLKWSLKSLDLSHNPLASTTYLTDDIFLPALQSLYIVSTGLSSLDALTTHLKAPELQELNISCHRLAGHLPWLGAWFPNCTTLLATDNWFSSVDVEAVRGLEVLDIRNNEIAALPPKIGLLGNHADKIEARRLRIFECGGNKFRVPRINVIEKGTEAVLRDLRRMVAVDDVPEEWKDDIG